MEATINPGAGALPAQRGPVATLGVAPSSGLYPPAAFDHAVALARHPATSVPSVPSAPLNMSQGPGSMPATIPPMHIQPPPRPPGLPIQSVTMTDLPSHDGLVVHRQHYRPASAPVPVLFPIPIPHPNNSQPTTPFAQHAIPVASRAAVPRPCQHPHSNQQRDITGYGCPEMHGPVHAHQAPPVDIPIPLEGRFVSWTSRRTGDGGINVSLDEALDDFVAGVDAEMKGECVMMPPDPSLGGHWPGRYVEELGVEKGMILEWMKMQ